MMFYERIEFQCLRFSQQQEGLCTIVCKVLLETIGFNTMFLLGLDTVSTVQMSMVAFAWMESPHGATSVGSIVGIWGINWGIFEVVWVVFRVGRIGDGTAFPDTIFLHCTYY